MTKPKLTLIGVDEKLTPAQRVEREKDERNDARIQGAIERAKREGPTTRVVAGDKEVFATHDQVADNKSYAAGDRFSIIPIAVRLGRQYPRGYHYVLTDADHDAVMAGEFCQNCLCKMPAIYTPACPVCFYEC